ncbi:muscle M-line assembly protein unc-89 [Ochlerotatus camptorhynchus]|uniref:muscle M-line assembly protein unc-89 n=1 Tax=Ochlerotatus camptorhynchus TaxID=644619 RepID=UPI0031DB25B0
MSESDSPRSILARLEQLKQWQEEQQRVLMQKQIAQRELLSQEQQKMYAILGLDHSSSGTAPIVFHEESDSDDPEYEETNMQRQLVAEQRKKVIELKDSDDEDEERKMYRKRSSPWEEAAEGKKVPTKPFLKRGEGLKARFKVDPNVFKLDNLPKYKYANLAKSRAQSAKKQKQSEEPEKVDRTDDRRRSEEPKPSRKPTKREESPPLKVALDINKVQDKKLIVEPVFLNPHRTGCPEEVQEDAVTDSEESLLPSLEALKLRQAVAEQQQSAPTHPQVLPNLPWKQQLQNDPSLLRQLKELKDLNLFELLEQRLASGNTSLASDASTLLKLLAENSVDVSGILGLSDSTIVPTFAAPKNPEEPLVEPEEVSSCLQIHPVPDPKRHFLKDDDYSSGSSSSSGSSDSESDDDEGKIHVHFADDPDRSHEIDTDVESQLETVNFSRMSTPKDKPKDRRSADAEDEPTVTEKGDQEQKRIREDILEKSELLKQRLTELETEIESFRKENSELMRMKQEHELEKIKLEQDREEMMEKLNDERIKMEVYFHDERIKIDDERQKALKEALKPTKKEKEEILRLKEQIADMQKESKAKETKHASSLARFRSQIKNLEKDLRETQLELEVIKKDNKKLETENARLKRQNNNRMLLEINKNLAKLAAPSAEPSSESRRNSSPEKPRKNTCFAKIKPIEVLEKNIAGKVAKVNVISHPRGRTESRRSKLSSSESETDSEPAVLENSSSSSEDTSSGKAERSRSSYFQGKAKKGLFQAETNDQNQLGTDKSPKTAELINSLKRETVNEDGSRDIWYPNGNLKKISPDGLVIRMLYFNKDIKETNMSEGTTKYYYYETNTWHTTYLDGLEILEFPDGQTEHRFKDGSTEVHFPNGSIRTTNPNSVDIAEEWKYPDGSTVIIKKNDDKVINLPNGQVEIHTKVHKRRIYPDGTIKFLYPDGSQESRYSNGRVRLKDKDGKLVSDTGGTG